MSFIYPWFLSLLLPIAIYIFFRSKRQSLAQNMRWGALGMLIIALSQPTIQGSNSDVKLPANSIILAFDISRSMLGEDISPNREEATQATIREFLKLNRSDQIALIGFTTNPLLLSPFTSDHQLILLALNSLKMENILTKGTSIKNLLQKVAQLSDEQKLLILWSDGGDEILDDESIKLIEEGNIKILTLAMATQQGSTIPTGEGKLLKDGEGHIVISKFNGELSKISEIMKFETPKLTAQTIQEWIEEQNVEKRNLIFQQKNYREFYYIPTLLALILIFLSSTRFITIVALLGGNLEAYDIIDNYYLEVAYRTYRGGDYNQTLKELAKIETKSLESELILGNSYYRLGEYNKAKGVYSSIRSSNPKIKQLLLYQLGNCEAKLAYYGKAQEYYIEALAFGEDNDTLHNLKIITLLKNKHKSKLGFTNPTSPKASSTSSKSEISSKNLKSKGGGAGGNGSKVGKNSTLEASKTTSNHSKRTFSSKAYDLINRGYIEEKQPW